MSGLAAGNDLLNLIYGGDRLTGYLGVFWFVTCLFVAQIIFNVVLAAAPSAFGAATLLAAVCWAGAVLLAGHPGPLAIGVAPFAVAMLWVGYAYGSLVVRTWPVALAAAATAATLLIACRPATLHLDMKHADFGPPVTGAVLAVALSLVALELCKEADRLAMVGPFLRWAGRGSLLIMFLHQPVHFATGKLHVPEPVVALVSLLVPLVAFELVRRSSLLSTLFLGVSGRHEGPLPPLATTPRLHAT